MLFVLVGLDWVCLVFSVSDRSLSAGAWLMAGDVGVARSLTFGVRWVVWAQVGYRVFGGGVVRGVCLSLGLLLGLQIVDRAWAFCVDLMKARDAGVVWVGVTRDVIVIPVCAYLQHSLPDILDVFHVGSDRGLDLVANSLG